MNINSGGCLSDGLASFSKVSEIDYDFLNHRLVDMEMDLEQTCSLCTRLQAMMECDFEPNQVQCATLLIQRRTDNNEIVCKDITVPLQVSTVT